MVDSDEKRPDSVAKEWVKYFEAGEAKLYQFDEGIDFLQKFIRSPFIQLPLRYSGIHSQSNVLEAGCGSGKFSLSFALLGHTVTALDFSTDILRNLESAKQSLSQKEGSLQLSTVHGDLEAMQLPDNSYDLVINEGVVEHWLDQDARRKVLASMARVAKPGGVVAVIIPNGNHPEVNDWVARNPAFLAAPPMVNYTTELLKSDLEDVGLRRLAFDGIYAWRTIGEWPRNKRPLQIIGSALDHIVPLPRSMRLKWGLHLIGMGRKI